MYAPHIADKSLFLDKNGFVNLEEPHPDTYYGPTEIDACEAHVQGKCDCQGWDWVKEYRMGAIHGKYT